METTDRVKRTLAEAERVAAAWGHQYVGTEHLLLALARTGGAAANVLRELGVTEARLETVTRNLLGDLIKEPS
jgi:ATP-dependent Clp protease ATP-binding subunit ClpC